MFLILACYHVLAASTRRTADADWQPRRQPYLLLCSSQHHQLPSNHPRVTHGGMARFGWVLQSSLVGSCVIADRFFASGCRRCSPHVWAWPCARAVTVSPLHRPPWGTGPSSPSVAHPCSGLIKRHARRELQHKSKISIVSLVPGSKIDRRSYTAMTHHL